MAAHLTVVLFGTTAEQAAESAENLYDETEAIEGTGQAAEEAEKSLASFDEINQLSGGSKKSSNKNQEIAPDFSAVNQNSGWLQQMMESVSAWVPAALMLEESRLSQSVHQWEVCCSLFPGFYYLEPGLHLAKKTINFNRGSIRLGRTVYRNLWSSLLSLAELRW